MKVDSVNARLATFTTASAQALQDLANDCYDDGVASVPAGTGISQADEDAAVAAGVAAQLATDAADKAQALAAMQTQLDALNAQLTSLTAAKGDEDVKLASDEAVIQGLKGSIDAAQAALDQLKALFPAPPPPPVTT